MSNEYKDWWAERVAEVLLDAGVIDKVEEVLEPYTPMTHVHGWKDGQKVAFVVWFDDELVEWRFEHRES